MSASREVDAGCEPRRCQRSSRHARLPRPESEDRKLLELNRRHPPPVPASAIQIGNWREPGVTLLELQNANGDWVGPTPDTINAAVDAGGDTPLFALDHKVPNAYPLVWVNHLYVHTSGLSIEKTEAIATLIRYLATDGQAVAKDVGEGRLPKTLADKALAAADDLVNSNCTQSDAVKLKSSDPGPYAPDGAGMKAIGPMMQLLPEGGGGARIGAGRLLDGSVRPGRDLGAHSRRAPTGRRDRQLGRDVDSRREAFQDDLGCVDRREASDAGTARQRSRVRPRDHTARGCDRVPVATRTSEAPCREARAVTTVAPPQDLVDTAVLAEPDDEGNAPTSGGPRLPAGWLRRRLTAIVAVLVLVVGLVAVFEVGVTGLWYHARQRQLATDFKVGRARLRPATPPRYCRSRAST